MKNQRGSKFEASIRRENGAFESLIRQKSMMMIPVDQWALFRIEFYLSRFKYSSKLGNQKSRWRKEADKEMQVIVDMREFMSSLPNVLNQKGMRIVPVTLEVGDYILSPLICVERKSIQDLFMSFMSGRLYHQVETMVRYYRIPVLLIEFSQDKSFSFQAHNLSKDHKPDLDVEKDRILKAGGFIQVGRINGSLNLARAIGTRDYFFINSNGWMNTSFCNS
ncbi:hypothetical protein Fmac_021216 [Flemingia macrophylla]|uniref:ERCC4 domain-containing protein n=1 Tax=Flemingia macrophylla TaxID=520843 RepID=A0ABD1LWD6_9FABA